MLLPMLLSCNLGYGNLFCPVIPMQPGFSRISQKLEFTMCNIRFIHTHDEGWEANLEVWNAITAEQLMKLIDELYLVFRNYI